jgi:hypothetical protein
LAVAAGLTRIGLTEFPTMLAFLPPALRREPPPNRAKSFPFDLCVPVLVAVLLTASLWFFAGNGPTTGGAPREQAQGRNVQDPKPQAPIPPGRAY